MLEDVLCQCPIVISHQVGFSEMGDEGFAITAFNPCWPRDTGKTSLSIYQSVAWVTPVSTAKVYQYCLKECPLCP